MKKLILLLTGIIATVACIFVIISLSIILLYSEFKQGKLFVIIMFSLIIAGFGFTAFKCFKFAIYNKKTVQKLEIVNPLANNIPTQPEEKAISSTPIINVNVMQQEVPQETLNNMKMSYSEQQAVNDMRIINESLTIIQETSDIDTFLSRYDTVMRCLLTLEQAKKAGISIALGDGFSQSLANVKDKGLTEVLYRSFKKELDDINKLKTGQEKLNHINKYQKNLKEMYENVFEFVAEDAYNDVMQKIEHIKNSIY